MNESSTFCSPPINILRFLLERFSGLAIVYFLHCHHLSAFKLVEFVDLSLFADAIFFLRLFYHTSSCIPVISGVHEYSFLRLLVFSQPWFAQKIDFFLITSSFVTLSAF